MTNVKFYNGVEVQEREMILKIASGHGHAISLLHICLGIWLLSHFLLPNTWIDQISLGRLVANILPIHTGWTEFSITSLLCAASVFVLRLESTPTQGNVPPIWVLLCLFYAPLLSGCFIALHDPIREQQLASALSAIAFGVLAATIALKRHNFATVVTIVGGLQSAFTLVYVHKGMNLLVSGTVYRAAGTFDKPNELYTCLLVCIPFAIVGIVNAGSQQTRLAYLIAMSLECAAFFSAWFRGGTIGLAVAVTVLILGLTRSKRYTAFVLAGMLVLVGTVLVVRSSGSTNAMSSARSNFGRIRLWNAGWAAFVKHPVTGTGVDSFYSPIASTAGATSGAVTPDEPKNELLFFLTEQGIGGGILFGLFVWSIIYHSRRTELPVTYAASATWIGLLVTGLVDTPFGPFDRNAGNCCFGLLLGVTAITPLAVAQLPSRKDITGRLPFLKNKEQ